MSKEDKGIDQSRKGPSFRRITPGDGAKYIEEMIAHCLVYHPEIATWLRGSIDPDMLEYPPDFLKRDNLGRRGGTYKDSAGVVCTVDQTVVEYRTTLENAVRAAEPKSEEGKDVELTDHQVTRVLYPKVTAKARTDKRARLNQGAQALLGKAMLLWPAQDVKDLMAQDVKLTLAFEKLDLIAFVNALKEFCLEGTGNIDNNIRLAENYIAQLKMVKYRFTQYIKEFKAAAENLNTCGSLFTSERIITLFMKNLDQSVFLNFYVNFLNPRHSLNELKTGTLVEAITETHQYYTSVIRVVEDDDGSTGSSAAGHNGGGGGAPQANTPIKVTNTKGLKEAVASPKTGSDYVVSHEVLVAFARSATKEGKVGGKRKADPNPSSSTGANNSTETPPVKKKCYAVQRGEECKFGSKCRFEH